MGHDIKDTMKDTGRL